MDQTYTKIILPTRPQPDTILGIFLLKNFGKEKYPGIENARIEVLTNIPEGETEMSLAEKGALLVDIGGGKFDHHAQGATASILIAQDLGLSDYAPLLKLLTYAERDDKYGAGTISQDSLDKAFGLSGLVAALNKVIPQSPNEVAEYIIPLLTAHYIEEKRRIEDLPNEFQEKLQNNKAHQWKVKHKGKNIDVVVLESDNPSMAGWLRSSAGAKADVVVQRLSSGYTNIMTKPLKKIDLRETAALIRKKEAEIRGRSLSFNDLAKPGRINEVPEWYYDRATNSVLNGGINPQGIAATAIPIETMSKLVQEGLASIVELYNAPRPQLSNTRKSQYFLEIRLPKELAKDITNTLGQTPAGIKLHRPENYHLTLMYLENYPQEQIAELILKIQDALADIPPFVLTLASEHFHGGKVPGYPGKSFYFEILEDETVPLRQLRGALEQAIQHYKTQEFIPHITVATAMQNVDEHVINSANLQLKETAQWEFPVKEMRLTEVQTNMQGQTMYPVRKIFALE